MIKPSNSAARSVLLVALMLAFGCESGGPEFVSGETVVIEGTLAEEPAALHFFGLTRSGTVQIRLDSIAAVNSETGEPVANPTLGVALGQPVGTEDNGSICSPTLSRFMAEGDSFSVFLQDRAYCLATTRPAVLPATTIIDYTILIVSAFS